VTRSERVLGSLIWYQLDRAWHLVGQPRARVSRETYLGLHLWTGDALWVDATLGYRVTPADLLELSGPTFALRAILNPW